jgi:hypothetical protein
MPDTTLALSFGEVQRLMAAAIQAAQSVAASSKVGLALGLTIARLQPEAKAYQAAVQNIIARHGRIEDDGQPVLDEAGQPVWTARAEAEAALRCLNTREVEVRLHQVRWEDATAEAPSLTVAMALDLRPIVVLPD